MYIIIPAYEPDKRLIQVVQDITIKLPKSRIIVVNDGSILKIHINTLSLKNRDIVSPVCNL